MQASWKRSPAALAVISWTLSLVLLAGYRLTLPPAHPASVSASAYSGYLSSHLREGGWFENGRNGIWAVVQYRIGADGSLQTVEVLEAHGDQGEVSHIVDGVRRGAPFARPEGASSVDVTELFWVEGDHMTPGSLPERLRIEGDDGRMIRFQP